MEVIHKSEFGVSEQSSFVETILILVNGHPRGGVSAFFREISAFFLIQNFVKFHAFRLVDNLQCVIKRFALFSTFFEHFVLRKKY